ncbi:MAG: hypothetical protein ABJN69_14375 [Hellea sp.]
MKPHIQRLFVLTFVLFIGNKLVLRPWLLETSDSAVLQGLVYSVPNFCEAVMGVIILTNLALYARRSIKALSTISNAMIYNAATLIALIYVITQEYGGHSLGGNNTYDPIDVLASILGLVFINRVIAETGFENRNA